MWSCDRKDVHILPNPTEYYSLTLRLPWLPELYSIFQLTVLVKCPTTTDYSIPAHISKQ